MKELPQIWKSPGATGRSSYTTLIAIFTTTLISIMWLHQYSSSFLLVPSFIVSLFGALALPATNLTSASSQLQTDLSKPPAWQKYVRSPSTKIIHPIGILSNKVTGNVTNPTGLITGKGPTILTRTVPANVSQMYKTGSDAPQVIIDFGQNIAGYLSIKFSGATNYTSGRPGIRLAFSETVQYGFLTNVSDFSRSDNADDSYSEKITPGSDQIAVKSTPYTWTDNHGCEFNNTQVCVDGIHGFRYVKIYLEALPCDAPYTTSYGSVAIESLSLDYSPYLGTPDTFTGWFESSDEQLNQWWYDGVYTNDQDLDVLDANSTDPRQAAFPGVLGKLVLIDGAKRDRLPYVGDIAVSGRTLYVSHEAPEAATNVLADLANHQRADGWIPPATIRNYTLPLLDYPLWWVSTTYDFLMYTGDTDFVQEYYHTIVKTLDIFYPSITSPVTQLITKGLGISGGYGDYAFLSRMGAVTYYNALYVLALDNAAVIAKTLKHNDDAARWTARARTVSDAINKHRWDNAAEAFFDGDCGGTPCPQHAQDGNSISIISGVANRSRAEASLSYMAKNMSRSYGNAFLDTDALGDAFSQRVYAFISYFELEARFQMGEVASALDQIRRMYSHMASNDPGVTMWEGIGPNGLPYEGGFTSMCHGWSTGIVPAVTNYILGVRPTGPGFSTWVIKPMPGDVAWAKGEVPTPHGSIKVYWFNNSAEGLFYLHAIVPDGTSGTISVPATVNQDIYVDSKLAWRKKQPMGQAASFNTVDGYVSVSLQGGTHVVSVGFAGTALDV
ncbi:Six-hairpin glycosidase-like protein [Calycina marina]|uniref:Six-hairpin glycosidase-like protein n=1 Tax=Calycina marina TaxID=1763456 RepID=A0A9P8CJ87_9HELO|nr:Six-hairpin glycosidase-like protein [Calycina marina]